MKILLVQFCKAFSKAELIKMYINTAKVWQ